MDGTGKKYGRNMGWNWKNMGDIWLRYKYIFAAKEQKRVSQITFQTCKSSFIRWYLSNHHELDISSVHVVYPKVSLASYPSFRISKKSDTEILWKSFGSGYFFIQSFEDPKIKYTSFWTF